MTVKLTDDQQAYLNRMLVEKKIEISVSSTDPYSNDGGRVIETMPLFEDWFLSPGVKGWTRLCDSPFMSREHQGKEYFIEFTQACQAEWLFDTYETIRLY